MEKELNNAVVDGQEQIPGDQNPGGETPKAGEFDPEKYKDVDLDKWSKLKDIDLESYEQLKEVNLEDYKSLREFAEVLEADPELYESVLGTIRQYKQKKSGGGEPQNPAQPAGGKGTPQADPRVDAIGQRQARLEARLEQEDTQKAMQEFDGAFTKSIEKTEFLDDYEKDVLKRRIEDTFMDDYWSGKNKLTLRDVDRLVKEEFKKIENYRKGVVASWAKKNPGDHSPAPLRDGSPQVPGKAYNPYQSTKAERVNRIADELKEKLE